MNAPSVKYTHTEDDIAIAWVERGHGPPLIVSTGPMLPLNVGWEKGGVWDRLSRSFRVIRFDPRGCGLSERDGVFGSFHDEANDLTAVINELNEPRVALMAYFIGTPAAVIALFNEPERFTHFVLHTPVPSVGGPSAHHIGPALSKEQSEIWEETVINLLKLGWQYHEEVARRALLMMTAPAADEATVRRLANLMHHYPSLSRLIGLVPEMRNLDFRKEVRGINVPTLVYTEPESEDSSENHTIFGHEWAREIPGARLVVGRDDSSLLVNGSNTISELAESMEEFIDSSIPQQTSGQATRSVLFTDIEDSTALVDQLGDNEAREIIREIEQVTQDAVERHDGVLVKWMGDGVLAWFGAASAAVDAAIDIQSYVADRERHRDVRVRIGISAGEPIAESDDLFGTTVNQAARIMSMAQGGQILVSDLVHGLVQGHRYRFDDLGPHELRGFRESVHLFGIEWSATQSPEIRKEHTHDGHDEA